MHENKTIIFIAVTSKDSSPLFYISDELPSKNLTQLIIPHMSKKSIVFAFILQFCKKYLPKKRKRASNSSTLPEFEALYYVSRSQQQLLLPHPPKIPLQSPQQHKTNTTIIKIQIHESLLPQPPNKLIQAPPLSHNFL